MGSEMCIRDRSIYCGQASESVCLKMSIFGPAFQREREREREDGGQFGNSGNEASPRMCYRSENGARGVGGTSRFIGV